MSSSSSDSDSDEFDQVRKIRINIRPKNDASKKTANIDEIKASIESWRPLGPPVHPSLSRRMSSMSSVSSLSINPSMYNAFGNGSNHLAHSFQSQSSGQGTIHSSPSCSSLVNEFNNRSSFSSNFISRTSSPLTLSNNSDVVPIAIAIQESIEVTFIGGQFNPDINDQKIKTRSFGNMKVAYPSAYVKGIYGKINPTLRLRLLSTQNITKYFASSFIRDPDANDDRSSISSTSTYASSATRATMTSTMPNNMVDSNNHHNIQQEQPLFAMDNTANTMKKTMSTMDFFDSGIMTPSSNSANTKLIDFDMEALHKHLKFMHDQSPNSRYYNVDVLRYQIGSIRAYNECPLKIRAYWKLESEMMKLRIDFSHSDKSGIKLERFRDISFTVDLTDVIPRDIDLEVNNTNPQLLYQNYRLRAKEDNIISARNQHQQQQQHQSLLSQSQQHQSLNNTNDNIMNLAYGNYDNTFTKTNNVQITQNNNNYNNINNTETNGSSIIVNRHNNAFYTNCDQANSKENDLLEFDRQTNMSGSTTTTSSGLTDLGNHGIESGCESGGDQASAYFESASDPLINPPILSYLPQANWNNSIKQLVWKFDNLLSFHEQLQNQQQQQQCTLMAKIDFRHCPQVASQIGILHCKPSPISAKFSILDSSMSKVNICVEPMGFKLSMLKKEIRAGKYHSEPYILH